MEISILTINRSPNPNYLGETLASLQISDWRHSRIPVNFIMGSENTGHVPHEFEASIVLWQEPRSKLHANFTRNYIRALCFHPGVDLVICEDDVRFSRNWLARLLFAVREIKASKFAISLYSASNLGAKALDCGTWHRRYPARRFYGTQGVFYPAAVRSELAEYLERNIGRRPGDLLIGEWCHQNKCLFLTQGSVIQHIGSCSTGLGGRCHLAWNLQR